MTPARNGFDRERLNALTQIAQLSIEEPYAGNSLLSKLLRRVMREIGGEVDAKPMIEVIKAATEALDNSHLPALVEAIKPVIDDFEIFPYEPWDDPDYGRRLPRSL